MSDTPAFSVLTWNLYVGSDFSTVFEASSPEAALAGASAAWDEILAADFPQRAASVARAIAEAKPDIIGLQEAALFRAAPIDHPGPATDVEIDYLELLLRALEERGAAYRVVAVAEGIDAELPQGTPPTRRVRLTNRDALLVRADGPDVGEVRTGTYDARTRFEVMGAPIEFPRSWISADVSVNEASFRMITTHLEVPTDDGAQEAQARELLEGPAAADVSTVVVGDLNSRADGTSTTSHRLLLDSGFADAWAVAHPGDAGLTCCQDANLRNESSALIERIDYVLLRGPFEVKDVRRLGAEPEDRTSSGLWPSDHAGVLATLDLS